MCHSVCVCVCAHVCKDQRITFRSRFSPCTEWVQWTKLRTSGLAARDLRWEDKSHYSKKQGLPHHQPTAPDTHRQCVSEILRVLRLGVGSSKVLRAALPPRPRAHRTGSTEVLPSLNTVETISLNCSYTFTFYLKTRHRKQLLPSQADPGPNLCHCLSLSSSSVSSSSFWLQCHWLDSSHCKTK